MRPCRPDPFRKSSAKEGTEQMDPKLVELLKSGEESGKGMMIEIYPLDRDEFFDDWLSKDTQAKGEEKLSLGLYLALSKTIKKENWWKAQSATLGIPTFYFSSSFFSNGPSWLQGAIVVVEVGRTGEVSVCVTQMIGIDDPAEVLQTYYKERYYTEDYENRSGEFWRTVEWRDICTEWWDILEVQAYNRPVITPVLNPIWTPMHPQSANYTPWDQAKEY
jgi:hypothetical protein